MNFSTPRPWPD